jgi:hypothetical protein
MIQNILGEIPMIIWPLIAVAASVVVVFFKVLGKLPQFKMFAYLMKPVAIVSFVVALFLWGGAGVNAIYMAQIQEMKQKIAAAEAESDELNQALETKTAEKAKVIHEVHTIFKTKVKEIATKIDVECKVNRDAIDVLNNLAVGGKK